LYCLSSELQFSQEKHPKWDWNKNQLYPAWDEYEENNEMSDDRW
jgi:hypothetical protein